jgi:hypothetical protein
MKGRAIGKGRKTCDCLYLPEEVSSIHSDGSDHRILYHPDGRSVFI